MYSYRTSDLSGFNSCACGCGKILDMVGGAARKFWYGHSIIGESKFWFYFNHPPKCLCGCGEDTSWDDVKLLWKPFKDSHGRRLSDSERKHLLRNRRQPSKQIDLFPPQNGSNY